MDLNKIGKYIAKKRQEKGFTQEILAKESSIDERHYISCMRGIFVIISI